MIYYRGERNSLTITSTVILYGAQEKEISQLLPDGTTLKAEWMFKGLELDNPALWVSKTH